MVTASPLPSTSGFGSVTELPLIWIFLSCWTLCSPPEQRIIIDMESSRPDLDFSKVDMEISGIDLDFLHYKQLQRTATMKLQLDPDEKD